ncbi:MAG: M28 family peptidase, partial [Cyclobacteriaceae bacterium]|nr:M28 family peptidase [Cyclobacteriaceae bacterium]
MKKLHLVLLLILPVLGNCQSVTATRYVNNISVDDLEARLSVLASDSLEGRETGMPGQKKAAKFIASHFESIGLTPPVQEGEDQRSYFQPYAVYMLNWNAVYLKRGQTRFNNFDGFVYLSETGTNGQEPIDILFIAANKSPHGETKGKYLAFLATESEQEGLISKFSVYEPAGYVFISKSEKDFDKAIKTADLIRRKSRRPQSALPEGGVKILALTKERASWIFDQPVEKLRNGDKASVDFNAEREVSVIHSENVMGYLRGTELPDEWLVITSHYDHIGITNGQINNGADDDGSGTTAVMEMAETFAQAAKNGDGPRRSILFMCVSGEEKGLLGSNYYTNNPVIPLSQTIVNLNIDMIGRTDPKHEGGEDYIYIIGSDKLSKGLHALS